MRQTKLSLLAALLFNVVLAAYILVAVKYWAAQVWLFATLGISIPVAFTTFILVLAARHNRELRRIRDDERRLHPDLFDQPEVAAPWAFKEYRSRWTLFGLPLVHVRCGAPAGEKVRPAVGWIALGDRAVGVLFAAGGVAVGGVSLGGVSIGPIAMGGVSAGLLALGGFAVGGLALGGAAVGIVAAGGFATGWLGAEGGLAVAVQPDGRVVVGGMFGGVNWLVCRNFARLMPDGSVDRSFSVGEGADGQVYAVALQSDGRILLGGAFQTVHGVPRNYLARLHAGGRLDASFVPALDGSIERGGITVQPDGRILVIGRFDRVNGVARPRLARLDADGNLDVSFDPASITTNDQPSHAVVQPDGRLLVSGTFQEPRGHLVRLLADGSLDSSLAPAIQSSSSYPGWVHGMAVQSDGKIMVGGNFTVSERPTQYNLARLNSDGSLDSTFDPGTGLDGDVFHVLLQSDGKVVVGGAIERANGLLRVGLARFNPDGSVDTGFNPGLAPGLDPWIHTVALRTDGRLLVGGRLRQEDWPRRHLIQLLPDGQVDGQFACDVQGIGGGLRSLVVQPDGKAILSGDFLGLGGVPQAMLARIRADGSVDASFRPEVDGDVFASVVELDGSILIGGPFRQVNGQRRDGVSRLHPDGTLDLAFDPVPLTTDEWPLEVHCLALQPDGRVLIGGYFHIESAGASRDYILRLNPDGSLDPTFNANPIETQGEYWGVWRIAVQPDGKILIGGEILGVQGQQVRGVARLNSNGSVDPTFQTDLAAQYWILYALTLQPDGRILVGGTFHDPYEEPGRLLQRLNPDGSLDLTFQPAQGLGALSSVALQRDGRIIVSGQFSQFNGTSISGYARLNPDGRLDPTFDLSANEDNRWAGAVALQPDGQILLEIESLTFEGVTRRGVVRLNGGAVPTPFVRRVIAGDSAIQLVATPRADVSVYAVEDQPPVGWVVTNISHGGVFDPTTGKVKWGPFFDATRRTLSYSVITPPCWLPCPGYFTGTASADGVNTPIVGDDRIVQPWPHPADAQPPEWSLSIGEVTAYGAAWRRGETWPMPPNPIPIDYVTRAGALWRGGECYEFNPAVTNAPLWWVNGGQSRSADFQSAVSQVSNLPAAQRTMPNAFVPGELMVITVSVTPAAAQAYAVEEQLPAGWTVAGISDGGELGSGNGTVKWGPFLDNVPRTLSYQAMPPATASGTVSFAGVASFDGTSQTTTGPSQLAETCRVGVAPTGRPGQFQLTLIGRPGVRLLIEASIDLVNWTTLGEVTTSPVPVAFIDPDAAQFPQRFYRARETP